MDISSVEYTHFPKNRHIRIQDKLLDLSRPKIMGIVNLTPDSFYSASRINGEKKLLNTVNQMIEDGADMIDVGGYSTRPSAKQVSENEEISRVLNPIIALKKHFPDLILSLDTFRGSVAKAGIEHGANLINDISGMQFDPTLLDVIASTQTPYILMHIHQDITEMHQTAPTENLVKKTIQYFSEKLKILADRGVYDVIIDPGFGFSKTLEQNYLLLQNLPVFHVLERPILVGISRKSMIYKKLNIQPEEALNGTTILNTYAIQKGASILRVHDVKEAKQIIQLLG